MNIRFVEEAQREFLTTISRYEEAGAGLGRRFKEETERCVLRMARSPELHRLRPGGYRRINLRAFPYYLPCIVRKETLWVLAIVHGSQQPLYWVSRRNEVI